MGVALENFDDFLSGRRIDTGFRYRPEYAAGRIRSRDYSILEAARGKTVLHVGFLDHRESRLAKGVDNWLHNKLSKVATELHGLDVDQAGIAELTEEGWSHLYTWESLPKRKRFDLVLVPDVLEHVRDLRMFLESVADLEADQFLFSTPNAFCIPNRTLLRTEFINSDHLQLLSPWTLRAQLFRVGLKLTSLEMCGGGFSITEPLESLSRVLFPQTRDTMVALAERIVQS